MTRDSPATKDRRSLQADLSRWSEGHAVAMIVVAMTVATGRPAWLLCAYGALAFALLTWRCRRRWTPGGRFGPANAVTMARLSGMFVLPFLPPFQVAVIGTILFALDGVDGQVARRTGTSGEFGAFLDQESDAFLMLLLCLMLHQLPDGIGAWILLPGLMRYLFVLFVGFARPPTPKERRSSIAILVFVLTMLSLLSCFAAYPAHLAWARPVAATMTLVLAASFAWSLYRMYRAPDPIQGS